MREAALLLSCIRSFLACYCPPRSPSPDVKKDGQQTLSVLLVLALPIFPARLQASIFGRSELNFRVRNGNGWTLALISTNLLSFEKESKQRKLHTSFYKKRSVSFSLLTVFFNSKYSIKFSSHCQELSLSYRRLSIKFFLPTFSFKKK